MNSVTSTPSLTSFSQLIGWGEGDKIINEIEIPLIQRDYAQGRKTVNVTHIRKNFVDSLCKTLLPNAAPLDLDFIFGDVEKNKGKFYPLDGQQRLTTMFLLHCYLAWRIDVLPKSQAWSKFSYATRPGAREFCYFLTRCRPDFSNKLSEWIKDHADYLPTWQHDPSIQSMLVVLDELHSWFTSKQPELEGAWAKLVDKKNPAIRFHVLTMKANGLTDDLYIKMNSRGKPLTPFENFKAYFESELKESRPDDAEYFAKKVDKDWSDILWNYCGDDHLIDDEFMRYFRFITEVCAWKDGGEFKDKTRDDDLAVRVYGHNATNATDNLKFLFQAFDIWKSKEIKSEFERILTSQPGGKSAPLLIFNPFDKEGVDLFNACCRHYGTRFWSYANTLFLYGVLLGFIHQVAELDFSKRLRILRNLIEASSYEIRAGERNNMPKLLVEVERIIVHADLKTVQTFNQVQVKNEEDKAAMLEIQPTLNDELHRLEDHEFLRGGLTVFDLEPEHFLHRSKAFIKTFDKSLYSGSSPWNLITGALLAKGDYSRRYNRWTGHCMADMGAPKNLDSWRLLFRGKKGETAHPTSEPLMALLDTVTTGATLQEVVDSYSNDTATPKDWRYYLVKYDIMREGASGRYTFSKNGGYQACMLNHSRMSSYYYDPYLLAIVGQTQVDEKRIANQGWPCCFYGYENETRELILKNSGIHIQCVDQGWQISEVPTAPNQTEALAQVCSSLSVGDDFLYRVPQIDGIDSVDRVKLGVKLFSRLIAKGL